MYKLTIPKRGKHILTNTLITILARKGSKRLPNKHLLNIQGKPLIQHTVEHALSYASNNSNMKTSDIVLSSDSNEILDTVDGAYIRLFRPSNLASDNIPKMDAIRHAVENAETHNNKKYEIVIDLDVTNPMRTIEDVEKSVMLFEKHKPFSLISVVPPRRLPGFNVVSIGSDGKVYLTSSALNPFDMNAAILIMSRSFLMLSGANHPVSTNTIAYIMDEKTRTDIDTLEDFLTVKERMEKNG